MCTRRAREHTSPRARAPISEPIGGAALIDTDVLITILPIPSASPLFRGPCPPQRWPRNSLSESPSRGTRSLTSSAIHSVRNGGGHGTIRRGPSSGRRKYSHCDLPGGARPMGQRVQGWDGFPFPPGSFGAGSCIRKFGCCRHWFCTLYGRRPLRLNAAIARHAGMWMLQGECGVGTRFAERQRTLRRRATLFDRATRSGLVTHRMPGRAAAGGCVKTAVERVHHEHELS